MYILLWGSNKVQGSRALAKGDEGVVKKNPNQLDTTYETLTSRL